MTKVDFFYDLRSPYAYFAWMRRASVQASGVTFSLQPVSIDVLLNLQAKREPWAEYVDPLAPPKRAHMISDIPRMARYWGIPIGGPFTFKPSSKLAMNTLTHLSSLGVDLHALTNRFFEALWQQARNIEDREVYDRILLEANVSLLTEAENRSANERLTENTRKAYEDGIFGVPSFRHNDNVYFGADRMDVLAANFTKA